MILTTLLAFQFLYGPTVPLDNVLAHVEHPEVVAVMKCESGLRQWEDDGTLRRGKDGELGIAQFKQGTWEWMNKLRGTDLDIENPLAQINMIDWAFGHGLQTHWTCYKKL